MKARIVDDLCQGHGMCHLACPQVFNLSNDDGHAYVIVDEVPPHLEMVVAKTVESCPEQAIEILT